MKAIIITACTMSGDELDLEIPAGVPLEKVADDMLNILKVMKEREFSLTEKLSLWNQGEILPGKATAEEAGLRDGSIVNIKEETL